MRTLLAPERGLRVVAEAGDGLGLVHLVDRLRPDLGVLDVTLAEIVRLVIQGLSLKESDSC